MAEERVFTVAELTENIASKLEYAPDLKAVWVKGEVAECTRSSMGHWYFNLKDDTATLKVVMFASQARNLKLTLTSGIEILVKGSISVYRAKGNYQMLATDIEAYGMGAYRQALLALMEKLDQEGLFKQKRVLPEYPLVIGVVTSPSGAAIADIRRIIGRRWPLTRLKLYPALVQGEEAPPSIVKALKKAYQDHLDLLILARGGGSSDDLWAFNDENVARTLYASPFPTITGVGHEIDRTLVDLVTDYSAPTPSGAAEVAVPDFEEVYDNLEYLGNSLNSLVQQELLNREKKLNLLVKSLEKHEPWQELLRLEQRLSSLKKLLDTKAFYVLEQKKRRIQSLKELLTEESPETEILKQKARLKELALRLGKSKEKRFTELKDKTYNLAYGLELLNPDNLLKIGYAVVFQKGKNIKSVDDIALESAIQVKLADGSLKAKVMQIEKDPKN